MGRRSRMTFDDRINQERAAARLEKAAAKVMERAVNDSILESIRPVATGHNNEQNSLVEKSQSLQCLSCEMLKAEVARLQGIIAAQQVTIDELQKPVPADPAPPMPTPRINNYGSGHSIGVCRT